MEVEIWSDVACPWCYIGKRRFEAALAEFEHADEVHVTWRSFELDPSALVQEPGDRSARLAEKYGITQERARELEQHITDVAAAEGLDFRFDLARSGNTFDSPSRRAPGARARVPGCDEGAAATRELHRGPAAQRSRGVGGTGRRGRARRRTRFAGRSPAIASPRRSVTTSGRRHPSGSAVSPRSSSTERLAPPAPAARGDARAAASRLGRESCGGRRCRRRGPATSSGR